MLGSLTLYRRLLQEHVFAPRQRDQKQEQKLPWYGHGIAGLGAGSTVSFIAAPVEHLKARLQIQYAAKKKDRLYSGPLDCAKKIVSEFAYIPPITSDINRQQPVPCSRRQRSLSRPLLNASLPLVLLLLVGFIRSLHDGIQEAYRPIDPFHKFLGGRLVRPDFLVDVVSL